jgi:hypothetical protein
MPPSSRASARDESRAEDWFGSAFAPGSTATLAVSGMAGAIANAATRTLVNGTDFGDDLVATLPDAIGQTIGNAIAGQIDASQQQDAPNSTLLNALKAQGLTDDQANQALSTFQALSGANGGPNMLDQGPSGKLSYTPQDATQQSAYDNALKQTGSTSIASQVASIVATKEAFDSYVANNSVPASVQATFADALLSEDVYFNQSIPELLAGTGYSRVTDPAALSALGVKASQFSDSKSGFYAALYEDSDTGS